MGSSSESAGKALAVLESDELALLEHLDGIFRQWARSIGSIERRYPQLIEVSDLRLFDYFENFPHLGLAVSRIDPVAVLASTTDEAVDRLPRSVLLPSKYLLPSAACYSVYLHESGSVLPEAGIRRTLAATCYRNEDQYSGLSRLLGFTMREIVCVAEAETAKDHLAQFIERISALLNGLGLNFDVEIATDPFFDGSSGRAKMQRLFPVKREFVVNGLAIGSVNYHRNFFGERCEIASASGGTAHTSCVAFGLERWVHVFKEHFGTADRALSAVTDLAP